MGYGAFSLWLIVLPERFGLPALPREQMIKAADHASRELKKIFHAKGLEPWKARRGHSPKIHQFGKSARTSATGQQFF